MSEQKYQRVTTSHNGAIRVTVDQDGAILTKLSGDQPVATVVINTPQQVQEVVSFLYEGLRAAGIMYTTDVEHVTIEEIPPEERSGYNIYAVFSQYCEEALSFSVQGLLQIADFVAANRARLEQEARQDDERNSRAWSQERADIRQTKDEWRAHRAEGDETPPKAGENYETI
jgi:hypothetical protein